METIFDFLVSAARWVFFTSLKASLLAALILLVQTMLRSKISARWMYALWFILLLRLISPFEIDSKLSIFNLFSTRENAESISNMALEQEGLTAEISVLEYPVSSQTIAPAQSSYSHPTPNRKTLSHIATITWFSGVLIFLFLLFTSSLKFHRKIKINSSPPDSTILDLFHQCKKTMHISSSIDLIEVEDMKIPVLFGVFRPKILLPKNFSAAIQRQELRNILLHELAHFKRGDILISWLTAILQAIHWFNPMIWFIFYRMRADRELACDEKTLAHLGAENSCTYGKTIIALVEHISTDVRLPIAVGIVESKNDLKRRIAMISNFKKRSILWSFVGIVISLSVVCVSFTSAQKKIESSKPYADEIFITIGGEDKIKVNEKDVLIDSLSQRLNEYRYDKNSIITLRPENCALLNSYFKIQMQLQSVDIHRIKYINSQTGNSIITPQYDFKKLGHVSQRDQNAPRPFKVNGKYGYKNKNGNIVISANFDEARDFVGGLACVKVEDKWGCINKNGELKTEIKFDYVYPLMNGLAAISLNEKSGFINSTGKIIIQPKFERVYQFREGLAAIRLHKQWGFINKHGDLAIAPQYDSCSEFWEGYAAVQKDNKWGFINKTGELVIDYKFKKADRFSDGLALVKENEKLGFINKKGDYYIEPKFDHAQNFSEGLAAVKINGKYGYIDTKGNVVIKPQFDFPMEFMAGAAWVINFENPELKITGMGKTIDKAGNKLAKK